MSQHPRKPDGRIASTAHRFLLELVAHVDPKAQAFRYAYRWPGTPPTVPGGDSIVLYPTGPFPDPERSRERLARYAVRWTARVTRFCPNALIPDIESGEVVWPDLRVMDKFAASVIDETERFLEAFEEVALNVFGKCADPFPIELSQTFTEGIACWFEVAVTVPWQR